MKRVWSSLFFLCAASASACGPFFPATVLDRPDVPLHALTFTFDLSGILPTNSTERAVTGRPDTELHVDDACRAAYLQGLRALGQDDLQAIAWFRLARQRLGHCDRAAEGLAAASIGWEARAELNVGNLIRAGELYVEHYASGDPSALMSLRVVAGRILDRGGNTLRAAGFDEEQRLAPATDDVQPLLRFHYRYRAAALAWEAAEQMPDNTEETARVLCTAGTWLKYRDPQAADRFYKALVNRCRQTVLGQEADRLRWFPNLPDPAAP